MILLGAVGLESRPVFLIRLNLIHDVTITTERWVVKMIRMIFSLIIILLIIVMVIYKNNDDYKKK